MVDGQNKVREYRLISKILNNVFIAFHENACFLV